MMAEEKSEVLNNVKRELFKAKRSIAKPAKSGLVKRKRKGPKTIGK